MILDPGAHGRGLRFEADQVPVASGRSAEALTTELAVERGKLIAGERAARATRSAAGRSLATARAKDRGQHQGNPELSCHASPNRLTQRALFGTRSQ